MRPSVARLFDALTNFSSRATTSAMRCFDRGEIGLGERRLAVDVVEEAVVGGGAVAQLGLGEELEDGRRHHVRGGVADDAQRCRIILFEQLQRNIFVSAAR